MIAKTSARWGILLGLALVTGTQILTWAGLGLTNWFIFLTYFWVILFMILAFRDLKAKNEGKLIFKNVLLPIVIIVLISRLIFQIYMFIYINYVDPTWVETVAESWTQTMTETGVDAETIEKRIQFFRNAYVTQRMFTTELIAVGIPQMVLGIIVSLFFVLKRKKSEA